MTLASDIRATLTLPAICAPMFQVTGPDLVREACKAGIMAGLPRANAPSLEAFDAWLADINAALDAHRQAHPDARIGPIAANFSGSLPRDELAENFAVCRKHGVEFYISATGDPTEMIRRAHDQGGKVFHDITNLRFAEKAIAAGADGLTCIGAGGGGHSGTITHLSLIPKVREMFDGVIVMAGAISNGAAIRAAEVLGADFAYLGTRFIATAEADCPDDYKALLVSEDSRGLMYTPAIAGVAANWMVESMRLVGLDPDNLPVPAGRMRHDHLPAHVRPWKNLWSAGQGIDLIHDLPTVATLVRRLRAEYVAACDAADLRAAARLVDEALNTTP